MKYGTPDLLKFKRLQKQLGVSPAAVAGHLEFLWMATAKNAPQGDIGRYSNDEIAICCFWDGNSDEFVEALVETGWLDAVGDEHRLLVHDWKQHAPTWVRGVLSKKGQSFLESSKLPTKTETKLPTKLESKSGTELPSSMPTSTPSTKPSQATPSQAKPSQEVWPEAVPVLEPKQELTNGLQSLRDNPRFWSTWERFKTYHLQTWHKEIAGLQEETILIDLSKISVDEAIHRIETAIRKGWKGIHPVREQPSQNHSNESPVELAINPATQKPYCPVCQKRFRSKQKSGCYGCGRPDFKTFPVDGVRA